MTLTPTTPENCRAMALECGRLANLHSKRGEWTFCKRAMERARELTVLARKLEQDAHREAAQ